MKNSNNLNAENYKLVNAFNTPEYYTRLFNTLREGFMNDGEFIKLYNGRKHYYSNFELPPVGLSKFESSDELPLLCKSQKYTINLRHF